MSRPQVTIDRLAPRRATVEPREAMNCKSCRKRKIKCNRLRPSCEACKVFQCSCIYDAVPKKRGPKTDVLEALLNRVDGLEKRLQVEKNLASPDIYPEVLSLKHRNEPRRTMDASFNSYSSPEPRPSSATFPSQIADQLSRATGHGLSSDLSKQPPQNGILSDTLLDLYFARLHGKPFYILDESDTRQQHQMNQLPAHLSMAISAMTLRYTYSSGQPEQSLRAGLDAALQARRMVDIDDPTIEGLQTLLLLSQAYFAYGLGKKAYMTFSNCVAMVVALDLLRESPSKVNLTPAERELRRRLFWAVYLMDRFITCGSRRPCLISDHSIVLRLPSGSPHAAGLNVEGELFHVGPNVQYSADSRWKSPSATSLLIDITRILGVTNRYLAAGGVKGDSHFPWHALSSVSKIRQELDVWAAGTQDVFASIEALFGHPESTTLLLSKLIYHLVHCLIYRPFLPIDLVELRGTGQHQSWQIEATNLCFSHSNAIAELVELGRNSPLVEWPAFVGYCVCTAGTVHVHGVHYKSHEGDVFSSSADFLTREMNQLVWLRYAWSSVQNQRELLQTVYTSHAELVRNLASSAMRFSPVFHLEDFLDRYPGLTIDGAHVRLLDAGDDLISNNSDAGKYQRHMPEPSYQRPGYYTNTRPAQFTLLPTQHPESDRRNSQWQLFPNKPHSQLSPFSPALHSHQAANNPPQTSPSFRSIFPIQHSTASTPAETNEPTDKTTTNNNPTLPSFSPSAFNLSPPPYLPITQTRPSNPQYATFPFDAIHANLTGASFPLSGRTDTALTPGEQSQTSGSHAGASESGNLDKDPFLSLLEQLAENEHSQGGPSELEFFLTGAAVDGQGPIENGEGKGGGGEM